MSAAWPLVALGEVLSHRKEFIQINDLEKYKRCRVKLHAQGIVLRDAVTGAEIKTKKQQVCNAGEFLVAEIDAKVGGFGIVPDELNGAIVSSHYFLFGIDDAKLNKRFLDFYSRTSVFRDQVAAQGSTNYAAIRPNDVFGYTIPLPPLVEQRRIVARIEELAAKIEEARGLRRHAVEEAEALITSLHAKLSGIRIKKLGEILCLDEDVVLIKPTDSYPQVGVRGFGGGLFPKSATSGMDTTYRAYNRLYEGALVMSQVKAWEGAVAVCGKSLAGYFVSPEYRTFRFVPSEALPSYFAAIVKTEWFWSRLKDATRGVGARRERTRPEQFLNIEIPVPEIVLQNEAAKIFEKINVIKRLQSDTAAELDAMLPSILDKAFRGDLF
jgi:type I restriction enzyme S subunit